MPIGTSDGEIFENEADMLLKDYKPKEDLPDVGPPAIGDGGEFSKGTNVGNRLFGVGVTRFQTSLEKAIISGLTLPGDVYAGKVDPASEEGIGRSLDLAGLMVMGPAPVASSLVDGTLGSFAGVKSRTFNKAKLQEAQKLESNSVNLDDIWDKTGWFKGADEQWRYEIPDNNASLKTTSLSEPTPLENVLDHPELFKAYPELKEIKVKSNPDMGEGTAVNKGTVIEMGPGTLEDHSTLMHEIQHSIQYLEGTAKGGSASTNFKKFYDEKIDRTRLELLNLKEKALKGEATPDEMGKIKYYKDLISLDSKRYLEAQKVAFDNYLRLAGEVEARNVQNRAILNDETLNKISPEWSEDTPRDRQIVTNKYVETTPAGIE